MTHDRKQQHGIASVRHPLAASLVAALGIGVSIAWPASAVASQALAQKYACVACHQPATKVVGPSWKDIGAKYGDGKGTAAQLAASIKAGSSGKWGAMPMPPQAQIPDGDLQSLAQWVLDGAK
ncbi:c-type cytochrome [Variovorax sp. NFACC27]|uniref:c-type cytochrome n=1 Tax=unclassified Variovorax TaxID=663243 RepID=UPI00089B3061|nr:cytochrome c [Variovorax sp. NFACC28]SEF70648.1 cytochrome c [Variovorax sp. NFACC29]SFB76492.1 cytochrome c [Variovorax sp. NFACC26]SFG76201.1 cytochrome c [Variovorax sp. NFACC27]